MLHRSVTIVDISPSAHVLLGIRQQCCIDQSPQQTYPPVHMYYQESGNNAAQISHHSRDIPQCTCITRSQATMLHRSVTIAEISPSAHVLLGVRQQCCIDQSPQQTYPPVHMYYQESGNNAAQISHHSRHIPQCTCITRSQATMLHRSVTIVDISPSAHVLLGVRQQCCIDQSPQQTYPPVHMYYQESGNNAAQISHHSRHIPQCTCITRSQATMLHRSVTIVDISPSAHVLLGVRQQCCIDQSPQQTYPPVHMYYQESGNNAAQISHHSRHIPQCTCITRSQATMLHRLVTIVDISPSAHVLLGIPDVPGNIVLPLGGAHIAPWEYSLDLFGYTSSHTHTHTPQPSVSHLYSPNPKSLPKHVHIRDPATIN